MPNLRQTAYSSIISTSHSPRWWILALIQVAAFSAVGRFSKPHMLFLAWLFLAIIILVPATVFLWLDIKAIKEKADEKLNHISFLKSCLTAGGIIIVSIVLVILARSMDLNWVFLALLASLIAATAVVASLYAILFGKNFGKALTLAIDTWHYKISMVVAAAVVLISAQSFSYSLAHSIRISLGDMRHFSVYGHSATIWLSLAILVFALSFFSALLNCFLVYLFLDIVRGKKEPEAEKAMAKQPVYQGQI